MFTGIITNTTRLVGNQKKDGGLTLRFEKPTTWPDLELGESIATDGVCLTVATIQKDTYECQLVPETLAKTTFGHQLPNVVNLERSLSVSERFGGHFVQGHVDCVGTISKVDESDGHKLYVAFGKENQDLVVTKGSITINGVSLTIADATANILSVALVPYTLENTNLGSLNVGDEVNLEFDMLGKYIVRIMENRDAKS